MTSEQVAREWLENQSKWFEPWRDVASLTALLDAREVEARRSERRIAFYLFNDALSEFVTDFRVDPAGAIETMKRRMTEAMK